MFSFTACSRLFGLHHLQQSRYMFFNVCCCIANFHHQCWFQFIYMNLNHKWLVRMEYFSFVCLASCAHPLRGMVEHFLPGWVKLAAVLLQQPLLGQGNCLLGCPQNFHSPLELLCGFLCFNLGLDFTTEKTNIKILLQQLLSGEYYFWEAQGFTINLQISLHEKATKVEEMTENFVPSTVAA